MPELGVDFVAQKGIERLIFEILHLLLDGAIATALMIQISQLGNDGNPEQRAPPGRFVLKISRPSRMC